MSTFTKAVTLARATARVTFVMLRRIGLHADRTPPAWVTRLLTFA